MLNHAFKEWAVICQALAEGRQAIILRKGGIAERSGVFQVEHERFWLYPTYMHQQQSGIKPEAMALLAKAEHERPTRGTIRFTHFAEVPRVYQVGDLATALRLQDLHCWTEETVRGRFTYRQPGLFILPVRIYRAPEVHNLQETAEYAGCKSWVELERGLPIEGATPVMDAASLDGVLQMLDTRVGSRS